MFEFLSFVLKKRVSMSLRACSGKRGEKQEFAISDVTLAIEEVEEEKSNQSLKLIK